MPSQPARPAEHDCYRNLEEARHVSRAKWVCSCGKDVSIAYSFLQEAISQAHDD